MQRTDRKNGLCFKSLEEAVAESSETYRHINLFVFGFPCQDISQANSKAKGITGERSSIFFECMRLVDIFKPTWLLIENVPRLLSINKGRDFATILQTLSESGYGYSWRVLDSQYFGVAQRRKRVFIVGCFGKVCPPEVLFEPESSGGNDKKKQKVGPRGLCVSNTLLTRDGQKQDPTTETIVTQCLSSHDFAGSISAPSRTRNIVAQTIGATPRGDTSFVWQDTYITETNPKRKGEITGISRKDLTNKTKGYIIEICTEKSLKDFITNANVAIKNPKCPLIARNVEKQKQLGLLKMALFAESNSHLCNHENSKPVLPDVHISCGENIVEIYSQKKLCIYVNSAVNKSSFLLPMPLENFVHLFASINTIGKAIILNGEVELLLKEPNLIYHWSGKGLEKKSGKEMTQLVKDVVSDIPTINQLTKYTTLNLSNIKNQGCTLITLFLSVLNAIGGYIPKEIQEKKTFRIQINGQYGWTYIYGDNSDSRRGVVIGNAVSVNVAEWIGKRILKYDTKNNRSK